MRSSSISIKKLLNPEENTAVAANRDDLPYEMYTFDDIKMAWHSFAYEMKEQGKESIYSALKRRDPKMQKEHQFLFEVDHKVMVDIIQQVLPDFNNFVRKRVKNYHVEIQVDVTDNPDEEIIHLTGKDKFQRMARKNPSLHTFKSIFNLDIEY